MRRNLSIIIAIMCIFINISYAEITEDDIVLSTKILYDIPKDVCITRAEFLTSIMRIAGMTDKQAEEYRNVCFFKPLFSDVEYKDQYDGYVLHAYVNAIAKGYEIESGPYDFYYVNGEKQEFDPEYFFAPDKLITVNEAILLTSRVTNIEYDEYVSLLKNQIDEANPNHDILEEHLTYEKGCLLLENILNSKRYLYFDKANFSNKLIDEEGKISYLEYIK